MSAGDRYRSQMAEDLSRRVAIARAKDAAVAAAQEKTRQSDQKGGRHRA